MINKNDFLKILGNNILIGDGAMGTVLQESGISTSPDLFLSRNKNSLKVLSEIHLSYLKSGSNIIQTSTFGANPIKLEAAGLKPEIKNINEKAVICAQIAVESYKKITANDNKNPVNNSGCCAKSILIAGNLGPTGKLLKPFGDLDYKDAVDAYCEQADILLKTKIVDLIIIETMLDLNEALAAIEAVKQINKDAALICTLTFNENGVTIMGNKAEDAVNILTDAGCAVVGANCSVGSDKMLETVKKMRKANPDAKLIFQPNAGLPSIKDGKTVYSETPEIMAQNIKKYLEYNPSILGACCGSTPKHIKKIAALI
ncbi:MAG: homocysteine S-methyltransferase family protein [Actinomycetota bacterium]|nr:homocysteine S-methyltransferase family protein [Actinomycetota bacterium]